MEDIRQLKKDLLASQKSEGAMFIDNCKLKMLIDKQHRLLEKYMRICDNYRTDIIDLKSRIDDFVKMDDDQVRKMRRDTYVMNLEKGKNEAMNKLRTLEKQYADVIRESR